MKNHRTLFAVSRLLPVFAAFVVASGSGIAAERLFVAAASGVQQSSAASVPPLTVSGRGFSVQTLATGAKAFANRAYPWQTVPAALTGWKFTQVSGGGPPAEIKVRADRDRDLYVAATAPPPGNRGDWQPTADLTLTYADRNHTTLRVYRTHLKAGASLAIPQTGWAGTLVLSPYLLVDTVVSDLLAPEAAPPPTPPPGVIVDYSPASTQRYIGSPALTVLPDGAYVAAHDFFGPQDKSGAMRVFRSEDRGRTWSRTADLTGQYWSSLFVHEGALYLLGVSKGFGNVVIRRSRDGGRTWTTPQNPDSGVLRSDGLYHCAPTPVLVANGRLWRAFEKQPPGLTARHFEAFLLSAPVGADLLRADSWSQTTPLAWNLAITHGNWLEGNAVQMPDGSIVDLLRIDAGGVEKASLLTLSPSGRTLGWNPPQDHLRFPGGKVKFTIRFDTVTKRYWSLVNKKSNPAANRNVLALTSSADLRSWQVEATLLSSPDQKGVAFQYADWVIDGEDLIAVSRTAWGGAHSFHDANYLTFHRIRHFRDPAARTVE